MAQVEPASARETGFKEERRREEKQKELKKVVGRQKGEKCSLALLPTETLHHLFSFLQVFTIFCCVTLLQGLKDLMKSLILMINTNKKKMRIMMMTGIIGNQND